jgi:hypothetical protein
VDAHRIARTGYCTRDDHFVVHESFLGSILWPTRPTPACRVRRVDPARALSTILTAGAESINPKTCGPPPIRLLRLYLP